MMDRAFMVLIFVFVTNLPIRADRSEENARIELQQVELWESKLKESEGMDDQQKIEFLGMGLRNMGYRSRTPIRSPKVDEIYQKIHSTLVSIPGHAEYYAEIIKSETNDMRRMIHFEILGYLPSPETVRVLGEMLSDTERYLSPEHRTFDTQLVKSNAEYAVQYLEQFKLAKIPRERNSGGVVKEDIARWKEWYDQVKAGRATFRFEGDPREYDLHGPVDGGRLASSQRPAKREEPHEAPEEEGETVFTPAVTVMTVMAVLLCLWALWQCWKMRPGGGAA